MLGEYVALIKVYTFILMPRRLLLAWTSLNNNNITESLS